MAERFITSTLNRKDEEVEVDSILEKIQSYRNNENFSYIAPLFRDEKEYEAFVQDHERDHVDILPLKGYRGPLYLGIDSGSTTLKAVLIDKDYNIR